MIAVFILLPGGKTGVYGCRCKLSVYLGKRENLVAAELYCAGFMNGDMTAVGGNDALPGAEKRVDHDGVGLCPSNKKKDIRIRSGAGSPDFCPGSV